MTSAVKVVLRRTIKMWSLLRKPESSIILRAELLKLLPPCDTVIAEDRAYRLPTDAEVISKLGTDWSKYLAEVNDCDDFVWRAKGKAAGMGWPVAAVKILQPGNTAHYIISWINDRRRWVNFEPQTREMYHNFIVKYLHIII